MTLAIAEAWAEYKRADEPRKLARIRQPTSIPVNWIKIAGDQGRRAAHGGRAREALLRRHHRWRSLFTGARPCRRAGR